MFISITAICLIACFALVAKIQHNKAIEALEEKNINLRRELADLKAEHDRYVASAERTLERMTDRQLTELFRREELSEAIDRMQGWEKSADWGLEPAAELDALHDWIQSYRELLQHRLAESEAKHP